MLPQTSPDQEVSSLFRPIAPVFLAFGSRDALRGSFHGVQPVTLERKRTATPSSSVTPHRIVPVASGDKHNSKSTRLPSTSISFGQHGLILGGLTFTAASLPSLFRAPPAHACRLWPFPSRKKVIKNGEKKSILIMMSNTGGGHKASAEALKQACEELYGDEYEIFIVDMWKEHTPAPFNNLPDTYSFMVKHGMLWRLAYNTTNPRIIHVPYFTAVHAVCARQVNEAFNKYRPDLVISVHPLMQHIPIKILSTRAKMAQQPRTPFATVVTDFTTCHNTWFHKKVDKCFVPTEFTRRLAKSLGLQDSQIVLHGLPIRPVFSRKLPPKSQLRRQLGLRQDLPTILLVGGGEGMGKMEETVEKVAERLGDNCQMVVICGRNQKLQQRLSSREFVGGLPVVACGFVDNIHEWMSASDMIITKAGPGTIAEALISGLPILLNGNVPCQEEGNIPYVVDNHVGTFETDTTKIADIIHQWLGPDREEFDLMAKRSKALGRPQAVYQIVRDLVELIKSSHAVPLELEIMTPVPKLVGAY